MSEDNPETASFLDSYPSHIRSEFRNFESKINSTCTIKEKLTPEELDETLDLITEIINEATNSSTVIISEHAINLALKDSTKNSDFSLSFYFAWLELPIVVKIPIEIKREYDNIPKRMDQNIKTTQNICSSTVLVWSSMPAQLLIPFSTLLPLDFDKNEKFLIAYVGINSKNLRILRKKKNIQATSRTYQYCSSVDKLLKEIDCKIAHLPVQLKLLQLTNEKFSRLYSAEFISVFNDFQRVNNVQHIDTFLQIHEELEKFVREINDKNPHIPIILTNDGVDEQDGKVIIPLKWFRKLPCSKINWSRIVTTKIHYNTVPLTTVLYREMNNMSTVEAIVAKKKRGRKPKNKDMNPTNEVVTNQCPSTSTQSKDDKNDTANTTETPEKRTKMNKDTKNGKYLAIPEADNGGCTDDQ